MITAKKAKRSVERVGRTVAAMVTGARMSRAKGLLSPPVKAKSNESCSVSNSKVKTVSASDRRRLSGKMRTAKILARIDRPMTAEQGPRAKGRP